MADEQKTINWPSVLTTAVSTLVATIVVGAAVMVWNKTANIDRNIANATEDIRTTQGNLQAQLAITAKGMGSLRIEIEELRSQLDGHDKYLREKSTATSTSKDRPLVLPKFKLSDIERSKLKKKEVERILGEYQKQIQIQQANTATIPLR